MISKTAPEPVLAAEAFKGYVDFYGYHGLAGGWFFAGWINHAGGLDQAPENPVAQFADQVIAGAEAILLYPRADVARGIGFLLFFRAPAPAAKMVFQHLTMGVDGATRTVVAVFEARNLPESQLLPLLRGIIGVSAPSETRQAMALLVNGGAAAQMTGCIEYSSYIEATGGWFFSGWVPGGWENGAAPVDAFISFAEEDRGGAAAAVMFARQDLPGAASGIVMFVSAANGLAGAVQGVSFHAGGHGVTLKPGPKMVQLGEVDAGSRLRANLALALPGRARERLGNILARRPFNGEDTLSALKSAVSFYVDEAISCGPEGLVLIGWMLARPRQIRDVQIRCGRLSLKLNIADAVKIARHDVIAEFEQSGFSNVDCGFITFLAGDFDPAERLYLQVEMQSGEMVFRGIPLSARDGVAAIKRVLETVDVRFADLQSIYGRVLGPAVAALNRMRLSAPRRAVIVDYGVVPSAPVFSVVVPLYRRLDFMEYQLALFSAHPQCGDVEFIYVLDDPTKKQEARILFETVYQRFCIPFRAVLMEQNAGFAPASNIGLAQAHGTFVAFMNSDVFPGTLDWLERLSARLIDDPTLGAVGPLLLYEDGSVQHRGMYYEKLPELGNWFFCQHFDKGLRYTGGDDIQRFASITGACMVMRRDVANQLGGFDESYVIGDFEDSDLCLRLGEIGLGCAVDPRVSLFHLERKSQNFTAHNWRLNLTVYNAWRHEGRWSKTIAGMQHA